MTEDQPARDDGPQTFSFGALLHPESAPGEPRPAVAEPSPPTPPPAPPPPPPLVTPPARPGPLGPEHVVTPPPLAPVMFPPAPPWTPRAEGTWEPPKRRRSRKQWIALVLVAALVSAGVAVYVRKPWESKYPSAWDARVAPIATKVAELRGLDFDHPVHVRFLPEHEFQARIAIDQTGLDDEAKQVIEDGAAELRALGLIGGDVDLLAAFDRAQTSSTMAYYDPNEEEIFVRGETLDVAHRVTIAHELTHVLQDQHFDLQALQEQEERSEEADAGALDAIIEGDAVRIEDEYLAGLSPGEQSEWTTQNRADSDRVDVESAGVPEILKLQLGAPYVFGSYTIRIRVAEGGNESVDGAFDGRALSARMYVEPGELTAIPVDPPALPDGATLAMPDASVSSFDVYVMLAARGDAQAALRAADAVVGGRYISYRVAEGPYCVQVALATQGAAGRAVVLGALQAWAATRSGAAVGERGEDVTFTTCDPGAQSAGPAPESIVAAGQLLALRGELAAQLAEEGAAPAQARCVARLVVRRTDLVPTLMSEQAPPPEQQQALFDAFGASGFACAANTYAGLGQS